MGIKAVSLLLTTVLCGALLLGHTVRADGGYCDSTKRSCRDIKHGPVKVLYCILYPTYKGSLYCPMNNGAKGTGVKALQNTINRCYPTTLKNNNLPLLAVDGLYGDATKTALKAVQKVAGVIPADGVYGPKTLHAIKWLAKSSNSSPECLPAGNAV